MQRAGGQKGRHAKTARCASVEPEAFSGNHDLMEQALPGKTAHDLRPHENNIEDPSEKYARRPRNKTKDDRYDYKGVPERRLRKRKSNSSVKKNPGAILSKEFQAPNIATERLTLRAAGPGFLSRGKTSGITDWRGLPDLTFSEIKFLKRKREDDNARFQQIRDANPKKKAGKSPDQEISDFFSRSGNSRHETTSVRKSSSMVSYASWSLSPPRQPASLVAPTSSFVAHPGQRGRRQVDERDDLSIHTSVPPNSSVSNRFLGDLTTSALFRGVDTSTPRERHYSLEDLRVLARDTTVGSSRHDEVRHEYNILRNAARATTPSQDPNDDKVRKRSEAGRMLAVGLGDLNFGGAGKQRYPTTQRQDSVNTAGDEPHQDSDEPAALNTALNTSVENIHCLYREPLLQVPGSARNITIPRKNERENELDLLPPYAHIPLSQQVRLSHHNQFTRAADRGDTISVPRIHQRPDSIEGRELPANTDERHVGNDIKPMQPSLPRAEEPSIPDHRIPRTEAIEAVTPISDVMDDFDKHLLEDIADGFTSGEPIVHGDDDIYDSTQDRPSRDISSHWLQSDPNIDSNEQAAHGPVGTQYRHGAMVGKYVQHGSRFPEIARHVVGNPSGVFNGFSRGQVLY